MHTPLTRASISTLSSIRSVTTILLASLLASHLCGCWGSSDPELEPEQEAKELRTDKDPLSTEVPEAELTRLAKQLYQVGMYSVARDSFGSLKDRYPMGAHAGFAELKYADTFFFNSEFNQAAKSYEDYLKNHPGSTDTPYCKLQAARSHVASARNEGRDRQPWERALTMYDEIVSSYPNTAYAQVATEERVNVIRELSAYDREIIEFYRRNNNTAAVEDRERRFQERWGVRLAEIDGSADTQASVVAAKALSDLSPVSADIKPPQPELSETSGLSTLVSNATTTPSGSEPLPLIEGRIAVQSVQCRNDGTPFATIELTKLPQNFVDMQAETRSLTPSNGAVLLEGLGITARQTVWDCFGAKDLEITDGGDLKLLSEHPITVTALEDPPRLLLAPAE
jgi:outer membrane assembly lipoprotein YfiO